MVVVISTMYAVQFNNDYLSIMLKGNYLNGLREEKLRF